MRFQKAIVNIVFAAGLAALPNAPAAGQEAPALPDVERLVADRIATVERGFDVQLRKLDHDRGGRWRRLFVDRVSFNGSYGTGLTVTDQDDGEYLTSLSRVQTQATWSINYKVPLSDVVGAFSGRSAFALEREIAEAEYREKLLAEEIAIRGVHNDYLKARARYESPPSGTAVAAAASPQALDAAFEMRALALKLLVLTRRQHSDDFGRWNRFLSDTGPAGTRIAGQ